MKEKLFKKKQLLKNGFHCHKVKSEWHIVLNRMLLFLIARKYYFVSMLLSEQVN